MVAADFMVRPMKEIIDFILNNNWLIKFILRFLRPREHHMAPGQSQVTQAGSTAYQAGRDIIIGRPQAGTTRSVRVRVHRAFFQGNTVEHYFINTVNTSDTSNVEVTHVWYEGSRRVDIIEPMRPLPCLLRPTESWETWVRVTDIPDDPDPMRNFRVRLSTDEVFESEERRDVPAMGFVPGD